MMLPRGGGWAILNDPRSYYDPSSLQLPPIFSTAEELQEEAYLRSKRIFDNWDELHKVLERYEGISRKRWIKRTQEHRKKILVTWSGMPSSHRPDFKALHRIPDSERFTNTRFRDEFM